MLPINSTDKHGDDEAELGGTPETGVAATSTPIDRVTQNSIGELLRAHFQDLSDAPLPSKLASLLEQLEQDSECHNPGGQQQRS